jgi:hypothetical protein
MEECAICQFNNVNCHAYPCMHKICEECVMKLIEHDQEKYCWFCRGNIKYIRNMVSGKKIKKSISKLFDIIIKIGYVCAIIDVMIKTIMCVCGLTFITTLFVFLFNIFKKS